MMLGQSLHVILCAIIFSLPITIYCRRHSGSMQGDITEMINYKEVERLIAQRKQEREQMNKPYLLQNDLQDDNYVKPNEHPFEYKRFNILGNDDEESVDPLVDNPRIEVDLLVRRNNETKEPFKITELMNDLRGYKGSKLLKSSKNALSVTKKDYLQKDWCKTEPLVQKIKEEGCLTRTIINRFCYGQCNSFYIPKNPKRRFRRREMLLASINGVDPTFETEDEDLNGPAFKSCTFCRPKKFTWISVTLKCPNSTPMYRKRRIQRIKLCKCIATDVD